MTRCRVQDKRNDTRGPLQTEERERERNAVHLELLMDLFNKLAVVCVFTTQAVKYAC